MNLRRYADAQGATPIAFTEEKLPPQVLVVDDSKDIRLLISSLLRKHGYRVIEAEDGLVAQGILLTEHPALVISDLQMPLCDGWEMLAYCHSQHPEIPVLIVSGAAWGQRPEIECWAAGFLPKTFLVEQLQSQIQRLLGCAA